MQITAGQKNNPTQNTAAGDEQSALHMCLFLSDRFQRLHADAAFFLYTRKKRRTLNMCRFTC